MAVNEIVKGTAGETGTTQPGQTPGRLGQTSPENSAEPL